MYRGKNLFSFHIPISTLVVLYASSYTCNIVRDVNLWFSKCARKESLFCDNRVIITYWLKKRIKNSRFRSTLFWKLAVTVNLKKFSSNTIFRWYTFGKFYIFKFKYFSGRPNEVKEMFWTIFNSPLCWWYWKKNIAGNY